MALNKMFKSINIQTYIHINLQLQTINFRQSNFSQIIMHAYIASSRYILKSKLIGSCHIFSLKFQPSILQFRPNQQKVRLLVLNRQKLHKMLKVTPFFPLSTKEKHTVTVDNIANDSLYRLNHSGYYFKKNKHLHGRTVPDLQRLMELSSPRKAEKNQSNLLSTSSSFFHINKSTIQHKKDIQQSLNHKSLIFNDKSSKMVKQLPNLNQSSVKYPKISPKKLNSPQQLQRQALKQNILSHTSSSFMFPSKYKEPTQKVKLFQKNRQLKQQKYKFSYTSILPSSDLSSIYSGLYNTYQQKPFNELEETEPILINLLETMKRQHQRQEAQKYLLKKQTKSFQIKQLQFEKNLRKQIKSLTRDTDHILSMQFKDIRDVNR